ncbi:hypothetical protein CDAR_303911 [Caerostris darwini]|uniref:Uncharacterized protein n=1 Tax=Caerostris darwini TaxID=1538125 RepID=A0AAV4T7K1_9ARAC|nr:hypothetical protein CDAR_303911 [Caerostris darwini]
MRAVLLQPSSPINGPMISVFLNYASHQRDLANLLVGANLHVGFCSHPSGIPGKQPSHSLSCQATPENRDTQTYKIFDVITQAFPVHQICILTLPIAI